MIEIRRLGRAEARPYIGFWDGLAGMNFAVFRKAVAGSTTMKDAR
jgi:hypothetical protein